MGDITMLEGDDTRKVQDLKRYVEHMLCLRRPWAEAWETVRDYVRPVRPWENNSLFQRETRLEDVISSRIMDNAAGRSVKILAAGLLSGLTPPTRPWFKLSVGNADLMESGPVRDWLWKAQEMIYSVFARSGFYRAQQALDLDLSAFCTGCTAQQARSGAGMHYMDVPIGTFVWDIDADGRISTVARGLDMAGGELLRRYKGKIHKHTRNMAEKDPYKRVRVTHVVMPRRERDIDKIDRKNKPYASYLYEEDSWHLIEEGGLDAFPYLCARWEAIGGEIYGRGLGFDALPDVRMLQSVAKDQSEAIRMSIKPPMKIPPSLKDRLYLVPGAKNVVPENMMGSVGPLYEVRADIAAAGAKIADLRLAIKEGYFNDLFLMLMQTNKNMTATEVAERNGEKLMVLGPVVENHQADILDPAVTSCFNALLSMGALDPVPEELEGMALDIEFTSILAQAQKMSQAQAIRNITADIAGMARLDPNVLDKIDFDQAVDELANIEGVPSRVVRADELVAEIRGQRAQAQQAEQQARQEAQALEGMKTLGEASTAPDTALGAMLGR